MRTRPWARVVPLFFVTLGFFDAATAQGPDPLGKHRVLTVLGSETFERNVLNALTAFMFECANEDGVDASADMYVETSQDGELSKSSKVTFFARKAITVRDRDTGGDKTVIVSLRVPKADQNLEEVLLQCKLKSNLLGESALSATNLPRLLSTFKLIPIPHFKKVETDECSNCYFVTLSTLVPSRLFTMSEGDYGLQRKPALQKQMEDLAQLRNEVLWDSFVLPFAAAQIREVRVPDPRQPDSPGETSGVLQEVFPEEAILLNPKIYEFVKRCGEFWTKVNSLVEGLSKIEEIAETPSSDGAMP